MVVLSYNLVYRRLRGHAVRGLRGLAVLRYLLLLGGGSKANLFFTLG